MYVYMCIYMYIKYMYRYMCPCVRDGYGHACGCTVPDAHVRAIAHADDAAVAITCACVGPSAGILKPTHTSCTIYLYINISMQSPGM
jgi:hypothetical protein